MYSLSDTMFRLAIVGAKSFARTFKKFAGDAKRVAGRGSGTTFEVEKSLELYGVSSMYYNHNNPLSQA